MTEPKKPTVTFDAFEWRNTIIGNLQRAMDFVRTNEAVDAEGVAGFGQHLDRIKVFVGAWAAAVQPAHAAQPQSAQANSIDVKDAGPQSNGAVQVKKRGGWPAGKPRKPKAVSQVAQ